MSAGEAKRVLRIPHSFGHDDHDVDGGVCCRRRDGRMMLVRRINSRMCVTHVPVPFSGWNLFRCGRKTQWTDSLEEGPPGGGFDSIAIKLPKLFQEFAVPTRTQTDRQADRHADSHSSSVEM